MNEPVRKKRYYSISEVSSMLDVKPHILRYWEGEFHQLKPRKNRAGNRAYTDKDIKTALRIREVLYEKKFTIEGARKFLRSESSAGDDDGQLAIPFERLRIKTELKEIRDELVTIIEKVKEL